MNMLSLGRTPSAWMARALAQAQPRHAPELALGRMVATQAVENMRLSQLADQRTELRSSVSSLSDERDRIAAERDAAQQEVSSLRQQAEEIAASRDQAQGELDDLRQQREEMQQEPAGQQPAGQEPSDQQSDAAPALNSIEPGQYDAGPVVAEFGPDNQFQMATSDGSQTVAGRYEVGDGILTDAAHRTSHPAAWAAGDPRMLADLYVAGSRTAWGSDAFRDQVLDYDSEIVVRPCSVWRRAAAVPSARRAGVDPVPERGC